MLYLNSHLITGDTFPNNEITLNVEPSYLEENKNQRILLRFENDADLIHLQFLTTQIRELLGNDVRIELYLPYVPYSRSDRPMLNRVFTLKAVCEFINYLNFFRVYIDEPHSDVTVALLRNVVVRYTTLPIAIRMLARTYDLSFNAADVLEYMMKNNIFFICPDNGAEKRYVQQILEIMPTFSNIRTCSKERELRTGRIKKFMLADALPDDCVKHAIIIDDLCSKGTTFLMCAEALKKQYSMLEKIELVVSHCESNIYNGNIPTSDLIQTVYISDSLNTKTSDKIRKVQL